MESLLAVARRTAATGAGKRRDDATRPRTRTADRAGHPRMLDFGCGPGRQTLVLAADLGGHVTAARSASALSRTARRTRAAAAGLGGPDRRRVQASMIELDPDRVPGRRVRPDLVRRARSTTSVSMRGSPDGDRLLAPGRSNRGHGMRPGSWTIRPRSRYGTFWEGHYPGMRSRAKRTHARSKRAVSGFSAISWSRSASGGMSTIRPDRGATRRNALRGEREDDEWKAMVALYGRRARHRSHGASSSFGYVFYVMERTD